MTDKDWLRPDGEQKSHGGMSSSDHKDALRAVYGGSYGGEKHMPGWTGRGRRMGTDERKPDKHVSVGRRSTESE